MIALEQERADQAEILRFQQPKQRVALDEKAAAANIPCIFASSALRTPGFGAEDRAHRR